MRIFALLFALLFATPTYAMNDLVGPFSEVVEMSQKHGVVVEKMNEADTAAIDATTPPRPQPSEIYLLTLGSSVILILVRGEEVIFSSNPVELDRVNKILGRTNS